MKRREFLKQASRAAVAASAPCAGAVVRAGESAFSSEVFDEDQWLLLEVVQMHLLPSEPDAPGAEEVNATAYLDRTLADPKFDPDVKSIIFQGIGWLNEIAQDREQRPFHLVEPAGREELLRQIAKSAAGERWLSNLISYTLEALLADPLYGGNPGGIGWKWLGHDPGQPRPSPDKIYGRLGKA